MTRNPDLGQTGLPFLRPLAVAEVPENGLDIFIDATADERAALAKVNGLLKLARLEADLHVTREGAGGIAIAGELRADVRQTCVVTLDEFDASVVEPIDARFAPQALAKPGAGRGKGSRHQTRSRAAKTAEPKSHHYVGPLDENQPDPIINDRIDLGALVAEFLALGLDPYPRKPGVSFAEPEDAAKSDAVSPFTELQPALKKGPKTHDL